MKWLVFFLVLKFNRWPLARVRETILYSNYINYSIWFLAFDLIKLVNVLDFNPINKNSIICLLVYNSWFTVLNEHENLSGKTNNTWVPINATNDFWNMKEKQKKKTKNKLFETVMMGKKHLKKKHEQKIRNKHQQSINHVWYECEVCECDGECACAAEENECEHFDCYTSLL